MRGAKKKRAAEDTSSLTKFMRVEIHLHHTIVCGSSCNHHSLSHLPEPAKTAFLSQQPESCSPDTDSWGGGLV